MAELTGQERGNFGSYFEGLGVTRDPVNLIVRSEPIPDRSFPTYPMITPQPFEVTSTPRMFPAEGDTGSTAAGAFWGLVVDEDGHTWLQGGQVKCGGSEDMANYKVIDASTGPVEADGTVLYIEITLDGYVEDGVLLAGATSSAVAYTTTSTGDTLPTLAASTGRKCFLEVGRFTETSFLPSGTGHFLVSFCGTGSYTVRRF